MALVTKIILCTLAILVYQAAMTYAILRALRETKNKERSHT